MDNTKYKKNDFLIAICFGVIVGAYITFTLMRGNHELEKMKMVEVINGAFATVVDKNNVDNVDSYQYSGGSIASVTYSELLGRKRTPEELLQQNSEIRGARQLHSLILEGLE